MDTETEEQILELGKAMYATLANLIGGVAFVIDKWLRFPSATWT